MVNVALIGCGGISHRHAEAISKMPQARVVALVDPVSSATKAVRERYAPDAREFASTDELYHAMNDSFNAVVIATTHTLHFVQATQALENAKHVLLEKPMVTTSSDAFALWRAAKKSGRVFLTTYPALYTPEYMCIDQMRQRGELGRPQMLNGWITQNWLQANIGKWRIQPEHSGGGHLIDTGAHMLSSICWIMDNPVVEVACMCESRGTAVDVNTVALLRFENGTLCSIAIGGNTPGWDAGILMQTDTMQIKISPFGQWIEMHCGRNRLQPQLVTSDAPAFGTPVGNFVRSIQGLEKVRVPVRHGVVQTVLMQALYESARVGGFVKVPPVPNEID